MESQAVARRESRSPAEIVMEGTAQSKALMQIVSQAGLSKNLGGSKPHLEVEAWITILRFNGYVPKIMWTQPIVEDGKKMGFTARAEAQDINTGELVSGAEADCRFDEEIERADGTTFSRWEDDYACKSMAQTRAVSKLGRVAFSWVAVLGGYSGTPAEEMDGVRNKAGKKIVFPFGKHKDAEPSSLELAELHKELAFWEKKVAEETNPKFKVNNERLLKAMQEAIAEKTAKVDKVEPPAAPSEPAVKSGDAPERRAPSGEETSSPPAGGSAPTEREAAMIRVHELREGAKWTKGKLTSYIHATYEGSQGDPDKLSVEQLRALGNHLAGQQPAKVV